MYKHQKFQCLRVNSEDLSTEILATFHSFAESLEFINGFIKANYELDDYTKIYHDDEHSIRIFQYYRIWSKKLLAKIHIVRFDDIDSKLEPKYKV